MRFVESENGVPLIKQLVCSIDEDYLRLRWQWPEGIQAVYIDRSSDVMDETHQMGLDEMEMKNDISALKLYTREEYKASGGYHDRIETVGIVRYTVYACRIENGEKLLIRQPGGENSVEVSTGRAKIRYSIRQKSSLLRKYKEVQISISAEIDVPKEALCYVKKQGSYPTNKTDGTVYPFLRDFPAGRNTLPMIEIGKNDYVRLFLTDSQRYGRIYELVPE